jgi:hypothetical protein
MILPSLTVNLLFVYSQLAQPMQFLLFYTDPGSYLPLASGVAAVIGFLLLIWQRFVAFFARTLRFRRRRKQA